jgi:RHS repeat-associated protein
VVTHNIGGGAPAQRFQYDAMGRVIEQKDCFVSGGNCVTTTAGYDVAGQMAWLQYPSGRKIAYAYQSSGRPETVTFERFGSDVFNYTYWTADHYHPNGALKQSTLGSGVVETALYNNRLQPTELTVSGSQTWADHVYHYLDGGSHNNGNVMQIDDQLNSGRTQSFGYDWLNRIGNAATTATSGPDAWAQTYTIDPWGNLLEIAGYHPFCVSNASNTPNNRLGVLCSTGVQMHLYDSSGNMTWDGAHNYGYDSEGRIKTVDTTAATYIYGPGGERVRKEVGSDATDYVIFNGQTIAEHAPNGDWSDYVYAGSKRIVRADDHEDFIRTTGNCTSCGSQWADFSLGTGYGGYVIQSGDKIFFRQWQANGGRGGLLITAGSASSVSLNDQDGIPLNADTYSNTWHFRRADLSSLAGNALSSISMRAEGPSGSGWVVDFREIVLVSTDGTVKPIYTRQPSVSVTTTSSSGMSSLSAQVIHWGSPRPEGAPLYYHGDHLSSARLLSGYSGYPIGTSIFLPYGEEFNPQVTIHHYKFTGKERDSETGLDNFGARYDSSQYGRFMTPDPMGGTLGDPQTLNKYSYVLNNPLKFIDPTGLYSCGANPFDASCAGSGLGQPPPPIFNMTQLGAGGNGNATFGNNVFDTVSNAPGHGYSSPFQFEFLGFVCLPECTLTQRPFDTWDEYADWSTGVAAQASRLRNIVKGFGPQLAYTVRGLEEMGAKEEEIRRFRSVNSDPFSTKLKGGNFDFKNTGFANISCKHDRCDNGLDFSHDNGTFHRDTANPFRFPGGTLQHLAVDIVVGNFVDVIPR